MKNKNTINPDKEVSKIIKNPNFTGEWNYSEWKQLVPVNCKTQR